jgi:hypothetical protein
MSDAVKKALSLELFNLGTTNPVAAQYLKGDMMVKDVLLSSYDRTKNNPEKYMKSEEEVAAAQQPPEMPGATNFGTTGATPPLSKGLTDQTGIETKPQKSALQFNK